MAGTLTIFSSGDGTLLSGHSWIEYQPDGGSPTTYGTWGNNPRGLGNGLHENLELGRPGDATRTVHLDDAQEAALYKKIEEYKAKGADGWGYLTPCSSFASDAWVTATGEKLEDREYGVISNPSTLKQSIDTANAGGPVTPPPPPKDWSSGSSISSPVQSCSSSL